MPEAVIVEVAEAVKEAIKGHDFGVHFELERSYAEWSDELTTLDELRVDVVPWLDLPNLGASGLLDYPQTIDVLIRKRFGQTEYSPDTGRIDRSDVDRLMLFVQDLWEFFVPCQPTQTGILTTEAGYRAAWDPETTKMMNHYVRPHLRKLQFTGWIRLGFLVSKDVG